jgi:hypothetical protein
MARRSPRGLTSFVSALSLVGAAATLHGCVALALPALATSAAGGGATELVRAGAAWTSGGSSYRTFKASLSDVYAAVQTTLAQLEFPVPDEEVEQEKMILRTRAIDRRVRIDLNPVTSSLISVRITAIRGLMTKEPATAATLIELVGDIVTPELNALPQRSLGSSRRIPATGN